MSFSATLVLNRQTIVIGNRCYFEVEHGLSFLQQSWDLNIAKIHNIAVWIIIALSSMWDSISN
ncbi:hypothetical protein TK45_11580 [Bowmanella sp. JS7-9]|nr:hypothetical protein TK45_11580 [Bowmanella sp. JS7-9]